MPLKPTKRCSNLAVRVTHTMGLSSIPMCTKQQERAAMKMDFGLVWWWSCWLHCTTTTMGLTWTTSSPVLAWTNAWRARASWKNQRMKRGGSQSEILDGIECLIWMYNKPVALLNNIITPGNMTHVLRQNKDGTRSPVQCPQSVK